ncbi:RNA helicase [Bacteroidetes/Chlorobi group bacterium ChocPot_Mid]|nr:MAG: RNA helicase [Bacteroidetes/Chlorobi group bacterium ChocPot_Mid]
MKKNPNYPLRHLSIRVPWHDNKWNGTICQNPSNNGACLILKNCAEKRKDDIEVQNAGQSLENLSQDKYPVCVGERATFMADFNFDKLIKHPYVETSPDTHGHFKDTRILFPKYSAPAVPYLWLMKNEIETVVKQYDLDYNQAREPKLNFNTNWLQQFDNHKVMLDTFFEHLEINNSLVFFYAKRVPFIESSQRVLVGVGKINQIDDGLEYDYRSKGGLRSMIWERMVHHSIRPNNEDGFLLPYHDALIYSLDNPDFDPAELAVLVPDDKRLEFSFATEHVTNDSAIQLLLECVNSIEKAKEFNIGSNHDSITAWIHKEINRIEKLRGNYPGLGSALTAFGIDKGHFVAQAILNQLGEDENPWDLIELMFNEPTKVLPKNLVEFITLTYQKVWKLYNKNKKDRIALLQLISRFEISIEQAKLLYVSEEREQIVESISDKEILANPYLIYEILNKTQFRVSFWTIDIGLMNKSKSILLPEISNINDSVDSRRIRALTIQQLEFGSLQGHSLKSRDDLVREIRNLKLIVPCNVDGTIFEISEEDFIGVIDNTLLKNGKPAYQLNRITEVDEIIRNKVTELLSGERHNININWKVLLDKEFDINDVINDENEKKAREEKAVVLKELADSRISVLLGAAGTGKTTLLNILCNQDIIRKGGVLFLAPTGKARVRMQQATKVANIRAFTIAQFLYKFKRYNINLQSYEILNEDFCQEFETVIVDESSMLTEEMLGSILNCLEGVNRLILVGDHRQLPPIGTGRPFVDIINKLKPENTDYIFPKVSKGYAELTIRRRHKGTNRHDIAFAELFSGNRIEPGEDKIFEELLINPNQKHIHLVKWKNEVDFLTSLNDKIIENLNLNSIEDKHNFDLSLGGSSVNGGLVYFNKGAAEKIENWQILTPVRERLWGTKSLNRHIHKTFKSDTIEYSYTKFKLPKPMGIEQIVYGDKVINVANQSRYIKTVYPQDGDNYLANGEIGIVIGQFKNKFHTFSGRPQNIEIEFSTQRGYKYSFNHRDFGEESETSIELAYALTIHKSQGSEFGLTFVIIPNPCFILSRELIYTALTRQKDKVIVLYQDDLLSLRRYSSDLYSETLQRLTNLFEAPTPREIQGKFLEEGLIHVSSDNKLFRSKSELIIYEQLKKFGLKPIYEKELTIDNVTKYPDFTIEVSSKGRIYYWEHCGLLLDSEYKKRWEEKLVWYKKNEILPIDEGVGSNGTLIITNDSKNKGISIPEIETIIQLIK